MTSTTEIRRKVVHHVSGNPSATRPLEGGKNSNRYAVWSKEDTGGPELGFFNIEFYSSTNVTERIPLLEDMELEPRGIVALVTDYEATEQDQTLLEPPDRLLRETTFDLMLEGVNAVVIDKELAISSSALSPRLFTLWKTSFASRLSCWAAR